MNTSWYEITAPVSHVANICGGKSQLAYNCSGRNLLACYYGNRSSVALKCCGESQVVHENGCLKNVFSKNKD